MTGQTTDPLLCDPQVKDKQAHLIRERETYEDLFAKERAVPAAALALTSKPAVVTEASSEAEASS